MYPSIFYLINTLYGILMDIYLVFIIFSHLIVFFNTNFKKRLNIIMFFTQSYK